jgi:hypothetical protein
VSFNGQGWREGGLNKPMPVDIGTTTITGLQIGACAADMGVQEGVLSHPVLRTVPLAASVSHALGSDFARVGLLFEPPTLQGDEFTDAYGVRWLWAEGQPAPLRHPLQSATLAQIAGHSRPAWPGQVQVANGAGPSVLDSPCPGLLETCFALRNSWQFMQDLTDNWRVANALLDWALETVVSAYEQALAGLPQPPDLLLYGDDYGFTGGMFLAVTDFRHFVRPRLQTLVARLRRLSPAPILFHSCGAVRSIVPDLVALGVEALNLDPMAREMVLPDLRRELPADTILHGAVDLVALGRALRLGDMKSIAVLATELAQCAPAVAAPIDNLPSRDQVLDCRIAAAFVHALDPDQWQRLRRFGPVKSVLAQGMAAAGALDPLALPWSRTMGHEFRDVRKRSGSTAAGLQ